VSALQVQNGDIVELTDAGIKAIKEHKNNYTDVTKPIGKSERTWGTWDMANLWIGMIVSIAVYQVASGLIVSGMSWLQALFTIVLGHTLVMVFAVILGHFGTKYGITYPMLCKLVFGSKGTIVPSLVRGILGCFWFGVQAWIGGQALNTIIAAFFPAWGDFGFTGLFIAFIIFWAMNVYIAGSGSTAVQKLAKYAAPMLIVLSFIVIIWAVNASDWSVAKLLAEESLQGAEGANFWALFFPALSSMIAFDGGIALSMADFTRNSKTQKSQVIGQVAGAPIMTAFISFVGICGTAGAMIVFKEEIWEPAILVSRFDNKFIVVLFSLFIIMAVLTTNVAANLVPPTNVISTLFAKKISYKQAALIAAVLALFAQPWNALASAYDLIYNVCGMLGALLGPISGLYLVAYLFEHKTEVDLVDLYREDGGKYYYKGGWNVAIIVIFLASTVVILAGKFFSPLSFLFDNAYVIGSIGAGLVYYVYLKLVEGKQRVTTQERVSA
jgi:NCS1 family nucleobase:cation symporter-1